MASLNKVLLIGRLTRDPELRYTPQGTAVLDMSVAVNRQFKLKDGSSKEDTCFLDVVVWAKQAENCAQYLKKGRQVFVEGRFTQDRWEAPDGQKRSKIKIVATTVQFLDRAPQTTSEQPAPAEQVNAAELPENPEFDEEIPF